MMKRRIMLFWICVFGFNTAFAQEILTLEEAIRLGFEHNFGIKIAQNSVDISKNNTSAGNNNKLPTLTVNGGTQYVNSNVDNETQDGQNIVIDGAETTSMNGSVNLNYTLFDGGNRPLNTKSLKAYLRLSELQKVAQEEQLYVDISTAFYQVVQLNKNEENISETLDISLKRYERAKTNNSFGKGTSLDLLNAKVDLKNDSIEFLTINQQLKSAKRNLNLILGIDLSIYYTVNTDLPDFDLLNFEVLETEMKSKNSLLQQLNEQTDINHLNLDMLKSRYMPKLNLQSSYNWNKSINPATSLFAQNSAAGFNAGLNLTWNIFDGGKTNVMIQNSKIEIETQKLQVEEQVFVIENSLNDLWDRYKTALYIFKAQSDNVDFNLDNFERTEEKFKLGQVSSIEFRQAQLNYITAKTQKNNAKIDVKLLELSLLQMSGGLQR